MEQGTNTASSTEMPPKRKRGRPKKSRPPVPGIQGDRSGSTTPTTNIPSNGKERVEEGEDDEMVGQMVTGIVENDFDGGYVINIRAGDSNVCFRGVVFKEGCVVPVTPENDIAPDAKMYKRSEHPIPMVNSSSIVGQTADTCLNPMENIEHLPQKILSEDVTRNDDQLPANGKLDDMEQQEKISDDKEQDKKLSDDIVEEQRVNLLDDKFQLEKLLKRDEKSESLIDSSKSPMKRQKIDQVTVSSIQCKDAVKSDDATNIGLVFNEASIIPSETVLSVKDLSVATAEMAAQEVCSTAGLEINVDDYIIDFPVFLSDIEPMESWKLNPREL